MFRPLRVTNQLRSGRATTLMAKKGQNARDLPQLLNTDFAINIQNYLIETDGRLTKRKGLESMTEVAGDVPITMFKRFTDDIFIFGYGTTVAAYTVSTDTVTTIKSDFSSNDGFDGARYGDFFFVCNGVDKIYRITTGLVETEVSASPICKVLKVIGPRLYAGNLSTDETAVQYSEVDDGSDPPFDGWTDASGADAGGVINYRNAGPVRAIESIGENVVVWGDFGKWAFYIDTIDSAGTLTKIEKTVMSREDFGGQAALHTDQGVFYVNQAGLHQLVSLGQDGIKYSDQEVEVTTLLGDNFFDDIDFTGSSIAYDANRRLVIVSCKRDSASTNNFVFTYHVDQKAITEITGWNINRFISEDGDIYGASSVKTALYQCFKGTNDDGNSIGTLFYQEVNVGGLATRKMIKGLYVQGFLSLSSSIKVQFDIYDRTGKLVSNKAGFTWTAQHNTNVSDGYGTASYGTSAYGGDKDLANTIESFDGIRPSIRNFQRIRLKISSQDKLPHQINWVSVETVEKAFIRRRKLTAI